MAHFSLWQRSPFRNNFMPSRRQSRQTGPLYLANLSNLQPSLVGAVYGLAGLRPAYITTTAIQGQPPQTQTRRFFGGRQPLCGMGVTSLIERTSIPAVAS